MSIDPTALIDSGAELHESVNVGPYAIIRDHVTIAAGTSIGAHVVIDPYVSIGPDCQIFHFASIGAVPQAINFKGEVTYVKIGRVTIVREYTTIHLGTGFGGGITRVGEEN